MQKIDDMLIDHENRIVRLETEVKNMNCWMKSIDGKLDTMMEKLSYLEGRQKIRNGKGDGMDSKLVWSVVGTLSGAILVLVTILVKVI